MTNYYPIWWVILLPTDSWQQHYRGMANKDALFRCQRVYFVVILFYFYNNDAIIRL